MKNVRSITGRDARRLRRLRLRRRLRRTRREVTFNASGLEVLWRTIVFSIGFAFLIPIPWVLRWYANWFISQFALTERGAYAGS